MWNSHLNQGHYFCQRCGHAVYARYGGCRSCQTPLADLMLLDEAVGGGFANGPVGFDPFDGQFAFNVPGTDLAIEPDGQLDVQTPFGDMPIW